MGRPILALAFVVGVGWLPARAVVRSWVLAIPLSAATSGLVLGAGVVGSLLTGSALGPWVVGSIAAGWALGALALLRSRAASRLATSPATEADGQRGALAPRPRALGVLALLTSPLLAGSLAAPTEWDARAIWFFHAHWFWSGGQEAQAAMANPALAYAHADYPPLVPGTGAGLWSLVGGGDLRLAQAVTSVQTWLAVLLVALLISGLVRSVRRGARWLIELSAALFVVACFGAAGGFGTRGYADLLWAALAVAGATAALVLPVPVPVPAAQAVPLPPRPGVSPGGASGAGRDLARLTAVCFAAAMLTKGEGLVTVSLLFLPLAALRWLAVARRRALPWLVPLGLAALAGLGWPLVARRFITVTQRDVSIDGLRALLRGDQAKLDRLEPALRGLWGYGKVTIVTAGLVILAGLLLATPPARALRRQLRLGGGVWLPLLAVGCLAVFVVVLTAGDLDVHWWVEAGGFRTMTVVRCLLLAEVLVLVALAADALLGDRAQPPAASDEAGDASTITADQSSSVGTLTTQSGR